MTVDAQTLFLLVAMLTVIVLIGTLIARSGNFVTRKVKTVTAPQITEINTRLTSIETQVAKVEGIENRQIEISAKLENGIKHRLDSLVDSHGAQDIRINAIDSKMNEMLGMLKQHLNYDGIDRRSR